MRVVATSDLHGHLPTDVPEGDLLLIGGDIFPHFPLVTQRKDLLGPQQDWLEESFYPWLESHPHDQIVWIGGNHDWLLAEKDWVPAGPAKAHYLCDSSIELMGLTIHGTPWVPNLPNWAFHTDAEGLARYGELIPRDVDILLSHGPPFGYGDRLAGNGEPVGNDHLRRRIRETRPQLVVFGHIHEAWGTWRYQGSLLANVSYLDELYELREGSYQAFDFKPDPDQKGRLLIEDPFVAWGAGELENS